MGDNEPQIFNDDTDNVYGVNNLNYLQQQLKGYETESDRESDQEEKYFEDNDTVIMTHSRPNKRIDISAEGNSNGGGEVESSGDGAGESDTDEAETKSELISIPPDSDPTVSSHLQRLSQLIKSLSSDHNQSFELGADDLNEFLAIHKIKANNGISKDFFFNAHSQPVPSNGQINPNDLDQILDLQKKLNNLGLSRDTLSTTPAPVAHFVSGNGYYPYDATTVHIKAANKLKNPRFPDASYSTSQIVVNRPGGSVVFSLPNANVQHPPNKNDASISEDTLKTLLELSKHMTTSNQPSNAQNYIPPSTAGAYLQPIIQPVYYKLPIHEIPYPILTNYDNKKQDQMHDDDYSMQKISSVGGHIDSDAIIDHKPDDVGLSAVIHNHIPITIANPNPTDSYINKYHTQSISTTAQPYTLQDQHDSYGNKRPEQTNLNYNYYSYPPYNEDVSYNRPQYDVQRPTSNYEYNYGNRGSQPPTAETQYVQISHSQHDAYSPPYNQGVISANRPIPNYNSDDNNYAQKYYTPTPHLNDRNVNNYVNVKQKPFPTFQPTEYNPHTSASNPRPTYADTPTTYLHHAQNYNSANKLEHGFNNYAQSEENDADTDNHNSNENDETNDENENNEYNSNVDQSQTNENVMNLLANYNTKSISNGIGGNVEKKPLFEYSPTQSENHKQFVSLGGNFLSLETYQNSIEPYLQKNSQLSAQIEILTCATGVRQANSTDCTRYFVCNAKTGKVLSYACPPYTAFNADTKICNAKTYSECFPGAIKNQITISENKRIQQQAQQSLIEAQHIKNEAVKAQHLAYLIKLETQKILNSATGGHIGSNKKKIPNGAKATSAPASFVYNSGKRPHNKQQLPTHHRLPQQQQQHQQHNAANNNNQRKRAKRKIACRTEGKLPDSLSKYNYFLCFKGKDGKMRARKLQCPAQLIFCANTKMCTSNQRCNKN